MSDENDYVNYEDNPILWKPLLVFLLIALSFFAVIAVIAWDEANRVDVIAVIQTDKPITEVYDIFNDLERFPVVRIKFREINGYTNTICYRKDGVTICKSSFSVKRCYLPEFESDVVKRGGEIQFGARLEEQ